MNPIWINVRTCLRKYVCFRGRASQSEFWYWALFVAVIAGLLFGVALLLVIIRSAAGSDTPDNPLNWFSYIIYPLMVLLGVFLLFCLLPTLAAAVRRLRDAGYSPWLAVIPVAFLVGAYHPLLVVALSGMDSTPPEIPLPLCFAYLAATGIVCIAFALLLTRKSRGSLRGQ